MAKSVMLTLEDYRNLEAELEILKGEKRKEIAEKIKVARSYGDLSENSEYDDAKNEQAILEARIATIEADLKNAVLINEDDFSTEQVHLGSSVLVENIRLNKEIKYKIVGSNGSNPREGKISDESPIGKALIGAKLGDVVVVETPSGTIELKVLEISR